MMHFESMEWQAIEPIEKGWSDDRKYRVINKAGETLLLRLSDISSYEAKKKEYEIIQKYATIGFSMSQPKDFGVTDDGAQVYMLLSWVHGKDLEQVLPILPEADQYRLGREAGLILKQIHSLPLEDADLPVSTKVDKKLRQLLQYEQSDVRVSRDEAAIRYVREHINLIWRERPVYQHGDYHPGNLLETPQGHVGVIDFNRWEVGDPYEEFYKLESFGREVSVPFCIGQIDAYFSDHVPLDFWKTMAVYVAHASLFSIKWAEKFGQEDVDGMVRRYQIAFEDYDGFTSDIPKWYWQRKDQLL